MCRPSVHFALDKTSFQKDPTMTLKETSFPMKSNDEDGIRALFQTAFDTALARGFPESAVKEVCRQFAQTKTRHKPESLSSQDDFAVLRCDHLVLTVTDIAKSRAFYVGALGMREETFGNSRRAFVYATGKINLHIAENEPILPRAARPTPGSADLCFIINRPISCVKSVLESRGIAIELGPVVRTGAFGKLTSIYVRDPDGNLIELANETMA